MQHSDYAGVKAKWKVLGLFILAMLGASVVPASAALQAETDISSLATPEIRQVKPDQAAPGEEVTLTIDGRNFARGAYVSFTNPAIQVVSTRRISATQLEAKLAIGGKATAGTTSLYVSNPASSVAQTPFTIAAAASPPAPPPSPAPTPPAAPTTAPTAVPPSPAPSPAPTPTATPTAIPTAASTSQQFQVYNLGDATTILQSVNKPKGTLAVAGGKLSYQEEGKEVFSLASGDIKEIDVNTILGVNTGTFHVILSSGKTYNFIAASLRPADSQQIVDSLRKALQ